jgi:hypothetical protein
MESEPEWLDALRRNSGLALSKEGVWLYRGRPVDNPRVQTLFHRGVALRDDGEVILRVGRMWAYVESDGPIRFLRAVTGLDRLGEGAPRGRLLDGTELALVPDRGEPTVAGWGPDERLYLWLEGVVGPAICLREAHQALAARIEEEGGALVLNLGSGDRTGDRRVPVALLQAIPAAGARRPFTGHNPAGSAPRA